MDKAEPWYAVAGTYKGTEVYQVIKRIPAFDGSSKMIINLADIKLTVLKMQTARLYQEILKKHC